MNGDARTIPPYNATWNATKNPAAGPQRQKFNIGMLSFLGHGLVIHWR
jgi:hypothetical protein